jgi:glutathione S-transferase
MSKLHLVIGNKNYSSWSLRPWMMLTMAGIPFNETVIMLDRPDTKKKIAEHTGAGRVPVLRHGRIAIWESLAILEYLAELFPDRGIWPKGKAARATARAIASEMHAGFSALRNACPMNLRRPRRPVAMSDEVKKDAARIDKIWSDCRKTYGKGGAFLFGKFCAADAMFAPVASRFDTYEVPCGETSRRYMAAVMATPAFAEWKEAALKEKGVIAADEVD